MAERDLASVPEASAVPDVGNLPSYYDKINNLAGDEELCKKVRKWCATNIEHFRSQGERKKQVDSGGINDMADRFYRVAERRNTSSKQHQNTHSDVASTVFFKAVRTITAGQQMMFFNGKDLPATFEPEFNTNEFTSKQGKDIAEQQNLLETHTFNQDEREAKLKKSLLWNQVYGQEMISNEWAREEITTKERVPIQFTNDEDMMPVAFERRDVTRVKEGPRVIRHPLKDCYFDAKIDDMNAQRLLAVLQENNWESLAGDQKAGFIMNVDKLNAGMLSTGDDTETFDDKTDNKDDNATPEGSGNFKVWQCWCRIPVSENKKKGRGKWDAKKNAPVLYWATFVGDINGNAVCVRLIKNPYHHGEIPFKLLHAIDDDSGAYHLSWASILDSIYWQIVTNLNQAADNVNLRNKAPLIKMGPVYTRDLTYRQNMVIDIARGSTLETMKVPDTTQITLALHDILVRDLEQTTGADKPILGQALGARTSATEAKQVLDQALLPLDAQASYVADQLFPWLYRLDAKMWRQYSNPKEVLSITHNNLIMPVKPAELWGPFNIKVTAVTRFRNNAIQRQNLNSFLQNNLAQAGPLMGEKGQRELFKDVFQIFGLDRADEYFPDDADFDARRRAKQENHKIFIIGEPDEPLPNENHGAHLSEHRPTLAEYENLPDAEIDPERIRMMKNHIQVHENFSSQSAAQQQGGEQQQGLPGEIAGNQIEAEEGSIANL